MNEKLRNIQRKQQETHWMTWRKYFVSDISSYHFFISHVCCFTSFTFIFCLKTLVDAVPQFVPQHLICPLTKKMFIDPVKTIYGTVYERKAIEEHLKQ